MRGFFVFVIIQRGIRSHITLVIMGSRIKTTDTPVIFTARGEVLLMSKGSVSNRDEFIKRVTEAS